MPGKMTSISPWLTVMMSLSSKSSPVAKRRAREGALAFNPRTDSVFPASASVGALFVSGTLGAWRPREGQVTYARCWSPGTMT